MKAQKRRILEIVRGSAEFTVSESCLDNEQYVWFYPSQRGFRPSEWLVNAILENGVEPRNHFGRDFLDAHAHKIRRYYNESTIDL